MARKPTIETESNAIQVIRRFWLLWAMLAILLLGGLVGWNQIEHYLIRDQRFVLAGPTDPGEESRNLRVDGVRNASKSAVLQVFEKDYGRSIYQIPIAERRRNLLAVKWVKDATVSRVWPNELRVTVLERTPVAFVTVADGTEGRRPQLVDTDGRLLDQETPAKFALPVLLGLSHEQTDEERATRVRRMQKLIAELESDASNLSEIDAADPENIKIVYQYQGKAFTLTLGGRRFKYRMERFLSHYPDIEKQVPDARVFDLRVEDRITIVPAAQKIAAAESSQESSQERRRNGE